MKLLTLNTHSLVEENYDQKLDYFVKSISIFLPQIIALQEVNQTCCEAVVPEEELVGYCSCKNSLTIKQDNHIYNVVKRLREKGVEYYWTWVPIKNGYRRFDEGIALMSLSPILETKVINVSDIDDYYNWKTRKIIGIRTEAYPQTWFFSVHFGWWDDEEEPFRKQWKNANKFFEQCNTVWVMGDFNNPAEVRDEGYDMLKKLSWYDTYNLAQKKDSGVTVGQVIDGWRDKIGYTDGMRIDQIWCNKEKKVKSSKVIFNGTNHPVVSDHFGVLIEL